MRCRVVSVPTPDPEPIPVVPAPAMTAVVAPAPATTPADWRLSSTPSGSPRLQGTYSDHLDCSALLAAVAGAPGLDPVYLERARALLPELVDPAKIKRFLNALSDAGVVVDIVRIASRSRRCPSCGDDDLIHIDNLGHARLTCPSCSATVADEMPLTVYSGSMNGLGGTGAGCASAGPGESGTGGGGDGDNTITSSSNEHSSSEDRDIFTKCWMCIHGEQNPKLPPDLFDRLDAYFARIGVPSGAEVRAQPVVVNMVGEQSKAGTSAELLHKAFKALQKDLKGQTNSLYSDEFYVRHVYWGWPLPNARPFKERVFRNYARTAAVYDQIPGARATSLNAWFWLFQELRGAGFVISASLFNLPETGKIREWHVEIRKEMCRLASLDGDVPIPFFPTT